jgi:hypothetical protein
MVNLLQVLLGGGQQQAPQLAEEGLPQIVAPQRPSILPYMFRELGQAIDRNAVGKFAGPKVDYMGQYEQAQSNYAGQMNAYNRQLMAQEELGLRKEAAEREQLKFERSEERRKDLLERKNSHEQKLIEAGNTAMAEVIAGMNADDYSDFLKRNALDEAESQRELAAEEARKENLYNRLGITPGASTSTLAIPPNAGGPTIAAAEQAVAPTGGGLPGTGIEPHEMPAVTTAIESGKNIPETLRWASEPRDQWVDVPGQEHLVRNAKTGELKAKPLRPTDNIDGVLRDRATGKPVYPDDLPDVRDEYTEPYLNSAGQLVQRNNATGQEVIMDSNLAKDYRLTTDEDGNVSASIIPGSKADREAKADQEKVDAKDRVARGERNFQISLIDDTISLIDENPRLTTGIVGGGLSNVWGTDAYTVDGNIDTIMNNISFAKLQEMRDNSKTGGAVGQLTDAEREALGSTRGALRQGLDHADLKYNLERAKFLQEYMPNYEIVYRDNNLVAIDEDGKAVAQIENRYERTNQYSKENVPPPDYLSDEDKGYWPDLSEEDRQIILRDYENR